MTEPAERPEKQEPSSRPAPGVLSAAVDRMAQAMEPLARNLARLVGEQEQERRVVVRLLLGILGVLLAMGGAFLVILLAILRKLHP